MGKNAYFNESTSGESAKNAWSYMRSEIMVWDDTPMEA